ncbi:ABC [Ectocarpus sp. CCAP 1310/34]|nr:ABC [Ectocarpus sp. CCAP 1310/34]
MPPSSRVACCTITAARGLARGARLLFFRRHRRRTIAQNIAYGAAAAAAAATAKGNGGARAEGVGELGGGVTMDKVVQAAELANAKDFIEEFPDGFETFVGEGGVQLSGGQRQRIAIARAVLKDARILILDEATSALDAHSEALVQEALSRLTKGRTVLVIAHRLSTVVNADKICVLSQGKVIEEGKHDELLEREGAYYNLMSTQVRSFSTIGD